MGKKQYSIMPLLILLSLLIFNPTVKAEDRQTYQVNVPSLNIRTAPDHQAEIIGQLKFGNRLATFQEKYGWVQTYYNDQEVWVASQYLTKINTDNGHTDMTSTQKDLSINYNSVRLRTGPGTNHEIIGSTSKGDSYSLIKTNGDWNNILLDNGSTAWVASWLTNHGSSQPSKTVAPTYTENALKGYNIILDPGHGGIDSGSIAINGTLEKDLTLTITEAVAKKLREAGATVLLTRSDNTYVSLADRVKISHAYWTDAFISLHYDSYPLSSAHGVSTHYASNQADAQFAQAIQDELYKQTGLKDRGIRNNPYYVLRQNNNLSVLVELGFLTNPNDLAVIQGDNHQTQVANAITQGVINYFTNN